MMGSPLPSQGVSKSACPPKTLPGHPPKPLTLTHIDVRLHSVTGKPANIIGRCIPALKAQETKTRSLQASMCLPI
jgi:hypothetical protein